jgi:hypothetical protein
MVNPIAQFLVRTTSTRGMISPASATDIKSATLTETARRRPPPCRVDCLLERPAPRTADEIDPFVGPHVGDPEHGREQPSCSTLTSSELMGSSGQLRSDLSVCQAPEIHRDVAPPGGRAGPGATSKRWRTAAEVVRRQTEILHGPVMREDLLVVRKRDRQHRRGVGAVAERRPGSFRSRISPRARARRTMMAVGDVERRNS